MTYKQIKQRAIEYRVRKNHCCEWQVQGWLRIPDSYIHSSLKISLNKKKNKTGAGGEKEE